MVCTIHTHICICTFIHMYSVIFTNSKQKRTASVKAVQLNLIKDLKYQDHIEFQLSGTPPMSSVFICR